MWGDAILILGISICTAFMGEGLTWLMVYRTEKYQRLKNDIERQTKKLEKKKEAHGDSTLDRTQKRKMEREEERLKSTNRDLMMVKMKSMFAIGFAFTSLLSMFNSIFDGKVVAKLPFTPIPWLQGLSHRNLLGKIISLLKLTFSMTVFFQVMITPTAPLFSCTSCVPCLFVKISKRH